jgi:hypothetical protein
VERAWFFVTGGDGPTLAQIKAPQSYRGQRLELGSAEIERPKSPPEVLDKPKSFAIRSEGFISQ